MRVLLLVLLFAALRSQPLVPLLVSDPQITNISDPKGYITVGQPALTNDIGYAGAQWLWLNRTDRPYGVRVTFQTGFISNCPDAPTFLRIHADDAFAAYLNSVSIGTGNNYSVVYSFQIKPQCGWNNLTVVVTDLSNNAGAGVIYAVVQNQTNCYQCVGPAFYDLDTCKCSCEKQLPCQSEFLKWANYPYCGCACRNRPFTTCNLKSQLFNQKSCSCQCLPKRCLANLEQDPESCECRCRSQSCAPDQVWSYMLCSCTKKVCKYISCGLPKVLDTATCSCKCANLVCPSTTSLDNNTCSCVGIQQ